MAIVVNSNEPTPIFQMRLSLGADQRVGWMLADEGAPEDTQSFFYVVPWNPAVDFGNMNLMLAGTRGGSYSEFALEFQHNLFIQSELKIRFSINDPLSPQDFRGLPFLRTFPYQGSREDILTWYGVTGLSAFVPLIPLDLIQMDKLYLEEAIVIAGITVQFGRHTVGSSFDASSKIPLESHRPGPEVNDNTTASPSVTRAPMRRSGIKRPKKTPPHAPSLMQ